MRRVEERGDGLEVSPESCCGPQVETLGPLLVCPGISFLNLLRVVELLCLFLKSERLQSGAGDNSMSGRDDSPEMLGNFQLPKLTVVHEMKIIDVVEKVDQ